MLEKNNATFDIKDVNGTKRYTLSYDDLGNPDDPCPIFCVHGVLLTRKILDPIAQELVAKGRRVINVDLVGHGESEWSKDSSRYDVPYYTEDCAQLLKNLKIASVDWIGISLGGLIGIRAITKQSVDVRHFIMVDVAPEVPLEFSAFLVDWLDKLPTFKSKEAFLDWRVEATQGVGPLTDEQRRERSKYEYRALPDGNYQSKYDLSIVDNIRKLVQEGNAWDDWDLYQNIKCPTLVLRGENSPILSPESVKKLETTGPKAKVITIEGVGHYPAMADPKQKEIVYKFLENKL